MESLYYESFGGVRTQQSYTIGESLDLLHRTLLEENNLPKTIVEIGTSRGGFTIILANHPLTSNAEIHTFDISDYRYLKMKEKRHTQEKFFADNGITFYLGDALNQNKQTVIDLIQRDGLTLVFCDGGNKKLEVNTFAEYLKVGDIIFGHDYAHDYNYFKTYIKDKYWKYHELKYDHVKETLEQNKFYPFLQEQFAKSVWLIQRKGE